jgi:hypothetical protein
MNSPKRNHPKKKASCKKRHMRWVEKSKDHKGYCRPKHNKSPMTRKGRSRSNAKYYGERLKPLCIPGWTPKGPDCNW